MGTRGAVPSRQSYRLGVDVLLRFAGNTMRAVIRKTFSAADDRRRRPAHKLPANMSPKQFIAAFLLVLGFVGAACAAEPRQISGIYPSLATFNEEGECGTGAVVPWANRLWVVSYAPHQPTGSTDKLYEITPDLKQIIRPE